LYIRGILAKAQLVQWSPALHNTTVIDNNIIFAKVIQPYLRTTQKHDKGSTAFSHLTAFKLVFGYAMALLKPGDTKVS